VNGIRKPKTKFDWSHLKESINIKNYHY